MPHSMNRTAGSLSLPIVSTAAHTDQLLSFSIFHNKSHRHIHCVTAYRELQFPQTFTNRRLKKITYICNTWRLTVAILMWLINGLWNIPVEEAEDKAFVEIHVWTNASLWNKNGCSTEITNGSHSLLLKTGFCFTVRYSFRGSQNTLCSLGPSSGLFGDML